MQRSKAQYSFGIHCRTSNCRFRFLSRSAASSGEFRRFFKVFRFGMVLHTKVTMYETACPFNFFSFFFFANVSYLPHGWRKRGWALLDARVASALVGSRINGKNCAVCLLKHCRVEMMPRLRFSLAGTLVGAPSRLSDMVWMSPSRYSLLCLQRTGGHFKLECIHTILFKA